jgi:hypothetical protein
MAPLLFLLLLSVTAVSEHSFASRMLRILVVEADVVESVTDNVIEGTATLRVRDVGLGAESLLGKSLKAKYSIGLQQTHPKPWFRSSSDGPILKGARMVVAVQRLGTNFRVGIVDAWATGEDKSLETGQKLISQLKKLNTATTIPDVSNGIFDALKKGCVEEELMWERIIGSALWGNTQLLQRIADSRLHREGLRKSAQKLIDGDKRWVISDKHRSEALEAVRSTEEAEMLRLRTTILMESMGQQNRFCIEPWSAGFLKIAFEAERSPPGADAGNY